MTLRVQQETGRRTPFPVWAALRPLAWLIGLVGAFKTYADPDLWGHVRFGLDIVRTHRLTAFDTYSFTQDVPWTNHEWLSEAIVGFVFAHAGAAGLIALKASVTLLTYVLIWGAVRHTREELRWGIMAFAALGALPITYAIRPQLWTLLLLTALCRQLIATPRYLWTIPPLFAVWANLHGGWIVGLGLLIVWSVCRVTESLDVRPPVWVVVVVLLLSVLATLANPYGAGLWKFLFATVRLSRNDIQEWQPVWRDAPSSWILWTCAVAYAGIIVRLYGRPPLRATAVAAMLAVASLWVNRLVPLFVPAIVVLLAPIMERQADNATAAPLARTLIDVAVVLVASLAVVHVNVFNACIEVSGAWVADAPVASALHESVARGRMITWFDWGEYAIWHLSPELKVSFDGRRETVYSPRTIREQLSIAKGDVTGLAALERLSPEYVWLPNRYSRRTKDWLQSHNYRVDLDTTQSFVAVRQDLPRLRSPAPALSGCFP